MMNFLNLQLKCWVAPGEEEQKKKEMEATMAPPPMVSASIENRDQQTGAPAAMPPMGGGIAPMSRTGVTSRYAAMPNLGTAPGSGPTGSIFAGLKPPPLGNPEFGQARFSGSATAFKPNVFKPAMEETRDEHNDAIYKSATVDGDAGKHVKAAGFARDDGMANLTGPQDTTALQSGTANVLNNKNSNVDPRMLEVLSFWSVYREQGYSVEIMKEWVADNYDEDLSDLDYEHMLVDQNIALQVAQYIEENKQNAEILSQTEETMPEQVHPWPSQMMQTTEEVHQGIEAPYEAHESRHETSMHMGGTLSDEVAGVESNETDDYGEYQFEGPTRSEIRDEPEYATYHYDLNEQKDNPPELAHGALEDSGAVNHNDNSSNPAYWNTEPQAMESYHQGNEGASFEQSAWNTSENYQQTTEEFAAPHGHDEYSNAAEKEHFQAMGHGDDQPLPTQFQAHEMQNEEQQRSGSIGSLSSVDEHDMHEFGGVSAKMEKQPQDYGLNSMRPPPPFDASNDSIVGMGSFEDSQRFMGASAPLIQGESKTDSEVATEFTEAQPTMMWVPSGIINAAEEGNQHEEPPRPDDTVLATRGALEEIGILKSKLDEANNLVAEKSNAVEEIRNSLNEIIEQKNFQISQLEGNLDDIKAELSTVQAECNGISAAAHDKESALNEEIDAASSKIFSLEERIALIETQAKEAEEKRMSEASQIAEKEVSLRHELDQALEKIATLESTIEKEGILRQSVDTLIAEKEDLKQNLDRVLEEKQVSEQSLQEELTEKLERLQEEKDTIEHSLREEIESIKAKAEEEYQASPLDYYVMHSNFWNDLFSYSSGGNCAGSS
jgi:hypothetical protein